MSFLIIAVLEIMVVLVMGNGTLYVGLHGFFNPTNTTFNGTCCGVVCSSDCRLLFDVTVTGFGKPETKSLVDTPIFGSKVINLPVSTQMKNPLSFSFKIWPGKVDIGVRIYNENKEYINLVDEFKFTYEAETPRITYTNTTEFGMRSANKTRLHMILRYACDVFFEGNDCSRFCPDNAPCTSVSLQSTTTTDTVTDWTLLLTTAAPESGTRCSTINSLPGAVKTLNTDESTENCTNEVTENSTSKVQLKSSTRHSNVKTSPGVTSTVHSNVKTSPGVTSTVHSNVKTSPGVTSTVHSNVKTSPGVTSTVHSNVKTSPGVTSTVHSNVKTSPGATSTVHSNVKTSPGVTSTVHSNVKTSPGVTSTEHSNAKTNPGVTSEESKFPTTERKTVSVSAKWQTSIKSVESSTAVAMTSELGPVTTQERETIKPPTKTTRITQKIQQSMTPSFRSTKNNHPTNRIGGLFPTTLPMSTLNVAISSTHMMPTRISDGGKTINDDVMQYWPAIVGGVLGVIAVIAVLGVFIYVRKLRAQQKKTEDMYNVNPQTWVLETNENGTSGMSEIALETELV